MLIPSSFTASAFSSSSLLIPISTTTTTAAAIHNTLMALPPGSGAGIDGLTTGGCGSNNNSIIALNIVLSLARGGVEHFTKNHASKLDIGRVRLRLEGLTTYATICGLLMNGCLRLYSSICDEKDDDDLEEKEMMKKNNDNNPKNNVEEESNTNIRADRKKKIKSWARKIGLDAFFLCVVMAIMFGSYTTIVFGLLSLFCKTAIGRGYDEQFLQFWSATTNLRESGFESFLCALISFELAFVLSIFLKFDGRRRKLLLTTAILISCLSFRRWTTILQLSAKYLFPLRAEVQY